MTSRSTYRLLSESERQVVTEKSELVCRSWLADWCANPLKIRLHPVPEQIIQLTASEWLLWRQDLTIWAAVRLPKSSERAFLSSLFGQAMMPLGESTPLQKALLDKVLTDLLSRLAGLADLSLTPIVSSEGISEGQIACGSGDAVFVGKLAGEFPPMEIALGGGVVARVAPPAVPSPTPKVLAAREMAISHGRVRLEAVVGGVTLTLGDMANLAPGDVIALDTTIDQPILLRIAGKEELCHANLGTNNDQKAIQLERNNT